VVEPSVRQQDPQHTASRAARSSPWFGLAFGAAYGLEWLLWRKAPFVTLGFAALMAFSVVVALVPWLTGLSHPQLAAKLRRRARWIWIALPALVLHVAAFAFFGPYVRSGPSTSGAHAGSIAYGMVSDRAMANHVVAAVRNEDPRDLAFLLRLGADPNVADREGARPIEEAPDVARLRMLVGHGARFEPGGGANALARAAQRGDADMVREQLAAGADPNAADAEGWRALHIAAYDDNAAVVRVLLAAGADPALRNDRGETALDVAQRQESLEAAKLLGDLPPPVGSASDGG
jgi:hypothetical protein